MSDTMPTDEFVSMNAEQMAVMAKAVGEAYAKAAVQALHQSGYFIISQEQLDKLKADAIGKYAGC